MTISSPTGAPSTGLLGFTLSQLGQANGLGFRVWRFRLTHSHKAEGVGFIRAYGVSGPRVLEFKFRF